MKKFGGPGRMKQSCLLRQCTAVSSVPTAVGPLPHQAPVPSWVAGWLSRLY